MEVGELTSLPNVEALWVAITNILKDGLATDTPEAALKIVTSCVVDLLGDKTAHLRPGGLKKGENQYAVSAVVMISPDRKNNIFLAQQNFPDEQLQLKIPIDHGHPGNVVRQQKPLLLSNTDDYEDFEQILNTSRMGSSMYAPLFWQGEMLGQLICGAQARNTYRSLDLILLKAFADTAAMLWVAHGGQEQLGNLVD